MKEKIESPVRVLIITCIQATLILILLYVGFHPCRVSGSSMLPTYKNGQFVATRTKFTREDVTHGTVVCFTKDGRYYIKRVVGVPGDTLEIKDGELYVNGALQESSYDKMERPTSMTVTLGEDEYFVLGDNRNNSRDSREFGAIEYDSIRNIVKE